LDVEEALIVSEHQAEPFDIYIIGTGIIPAFHLTREAEAAIRRCREILYVDKSFGIAELLGQLCPRLTDLYATYREGAERIEAYRAMAARVIESALDHPPVGLALYGHPLVYSLPPFIIMKSAELLGLRTKVVPGISSLDTLLVDLRFDPCTEGVQMYEATDLLLRKRPIQPDVPCFIWQIGAVESRLFSTGPNKPERFTRIKEYLLNFYPPSAKMLAVYSSNLPLVQSTITDFTLERIEDHAEALHQGVTVFIPPIKIRDIVDGETLNDIDSSEYLKIIVN
jgi:Tetrapyrrole (Corrin/Porphyrin) Methylases